MNPASRVRGFSVLLAMTASAFAVHHAAFANHIVPPCEDVIDVEGVNECGPLNVVLGNFHEWTVLPTPSPSVDPNSGTAKPAANQPGVTPPLTTAHTGDGPAVAGDDLPVSVYVYSKCSSLCSEITLKMFYTTIEGITKELPTQTLPHSDAQSATFVVPGADVYWWNTETRTPYVFGYWFEASQTQTGAPVTARSPIAPNMMYEREVTHSIRMRFTTPDGTPVSSTAKVFYWLEGHTTAPAFVYADTWTANPDEEGRVSFPIPNVQQLLETPAADLENVYIWVFDAWPAQAPTEPVSIQGHGITTAAVLNLGNIDFPAVDPQAQDRTRNLRLQTRAFRPPDTIPISEGDAPECHSLGEKTYYCEYDDPEYWNGVPVPIVANMGGGKQMKGCIRYHHSNSTRLSLAVKNSSDSEPGGEWVAEAEVTSSTSNGNTSNFCNFPTGPNANERPILTWFYGRRQKWVCVKSGDGSKDSCTYEQHAYPSRWNTGAFRQTAGHRHDLWRDGDCIVPSETLHTSVKSAGRKLSFGLSGGPTKLFGVSAYLRASQDDVQHMEQDWWPTQPEDNNDKHHRYVQIQDKCPDAAPEFTWTHWDSVRRGVICPPEIPESCRPRIPWDHDSSDPDGLGGVA